MNEKDLEIRLAVKEDRNYWVKWLAEKNILRWCPMCNEMEIEDAVRVYESYIPLKAIWTITLNGAPCGYANLYIQQFKKIAHQCLFSIIIAPELRGKGIGTFVMKELMRLAKENFHIEQLHLEVYEGNPAKHLYDRLGFKQYGVQKHFLKEGDKYVDKILMMKLL